MNIDSYDGALKCWFTLDTKGFRGHKIDWLVWRLEDELKNSVKWFKDWHETMFDHKYVCTKRCHE
jgi:hypothetical protein